MKLSEVREKYLKFFEKKEHVVLKSASLLPENDSSTLFTNAGMQPMIPYILGEKHPEGDKLCDSQKCFRSTDIEEIGDIFHTTFFEMLGNWSLGSYFKKEQVAWIFDFLINELKIDPNRFYVSAFKGEEKNNLPKDIEAAEFWQKLFAQQGIDAQISENVLDEGMKPGEKIFYYDSSENWWSRQGKPDAMVIGEPGGPDSEMFIDIDPENKLQLHENSKFKDQKCHPNCDCGRFLEIGNSVFMTYKKTENGFEELANKNIDFGGGLERLTMAANGIQDIFELDVFDDAKKELEKLSGLKYKDKEYGVYSFRVILDHMRSATMLINDGAFPSNKDAGYITRRLIRKAVRCGHGLGITNNLCFQISKFFIKEYAKQYPDLKTNQDRTLEALDEEETKFRKTLEKGERYWQKEKEGQIKAIKEFDEAGKKSGVAKEGFEYNGDCAYYMFSTFGFPPELILDDILRNEYLIKKFSIEKFWERYRREEKKHKEVSKTASSGKFKGGLADSSVETTKLHTAAHLLLAALREVLGDHVVQKGSNITAERLRFDFSHDNKMTDEEKQQVEEKINQWIKDDMKIGCEEMTVEEADKKGAQGAFKDRYGEKVKVYTVCSTSNTASMEICGGPHIEKTSELGKFKIKKEQSSSAGVRRIKATLE